MSVKGKTQSFWLTRKCCVVHTHKHTHKQDAPSVKRKFFQPDSELVWGS